MSQGSINELFRLDGRVAIVTGAAGLIGQRHCKALAEAGATVYACDLDQEKSSAVAADLGDGHYGVAVDITDPDSITRLRDDILKEHGSIDVLVNNAAVNDMVENPVSAARRVQVRELSVRPVEAGHGREHHRCIPVLSDHWEGHV